MSSTGGGISSYIGGKAAAVAAVIAAALVAISVPVVTGGSSGAACTGVDVTTATFSTRVTGASPGDVLCLTTGSYGSWGGTNKAITVKAKAGQSPTMSLSLSSSNSSFTLDGMGGMSLTDVSGSTNVTIKNSTFTSFGGDIVHPTNMVLDGDHWDWNCSGQSKVYIAGKQTATIASPSVTIKNSTFTNGECDAVHMGGETGSDYSNGIVILNNRFSNICDIGVNHTDNIQFDSVNSQIRIAGNYFYALGDPTLSNSGNAVCPTQGVTAYDGNTNGNVIIEDNVVDIPRDWGIEVYDEPANANPTIIRHNTVVYHPGTYTEFHSATGQIVNDTKSTCKSTPIVIRDNIGSPSGACSGFAVADHNTSASTVTYVGGTLGSSSVFTDALLTTGSAGHLAASDGLDTGIRSPVT